jgi:hypothetical protein
LNEPANYTGQIVLDNNLVIGNGARGIQDLNSHVARTYIRNNTLWNNNTDAALSNPACAELYLIDTSYTEAYANLVMTGGVDACDSNAEYVHYILNGDTTDHIYATFGYSVGGTNCGFSGGTFAACGPNNTFGTNPAVANSVIPGAPSCGSYASVPACMAAVITNFTPTASAASGYGAQPVNTTSRYDPLYPQWLCTVTLPSGLVTPGCVTASATTGSSAVGVTIH